MKKLDQYDIQILDELQKDAKVTVKQLAEKIELSPTPIFERIKKLENSGVIAYYSAILDASRLGKHLYAFAHITLKDHTKQKVAQFSQDIDRMDEVQECHYVTGDSDFILKILLGSMEDYRDFMMNKIFELQNIAKVESFLSLSVAKKNNFISLQSNEM